MSNYQIKELDFSKSQEAKADFIKMVQSWTKILVVADMDINDFYICGEFPYKDFDGKNADVIAKALNGDYSKIIDDIIINLEKSCCDIERLYSELKGKHNDNWIGIPNIISEYRDIITKVKMVQDVSN